MNATTLDNQLTAIDRALAGLLEQRLLLLQEARPSVLRGPDLNDLAGNSGYKHLGLECIFRAIHLASLNNLPNDRRSVRGQS